MISNKQLQISKIATGEVAQMTENILNLKVRKRSFSYRAYATRRA